MLYNTYQNLFTIYWMCTFRNVCEWAAWILLTGFCQKQSTMKWPISYAININLMNLSRIKSTSSQKFPHLEWIYILFGNLTQKPLDPRLSPCHQSQAQVSKIPRELQMNISQEGILKLWTSCWPSTLDQWLSSCLVPPFFENIHTILRNAMGEKAEQPRRCDCDCGDLFVLYSCPNKGFLNGQFLNLGRTKSLQQQIEFLNTSPGWQIVVWEECATFMYNEGTAQGNLALEKNSATLAPGHRRVAPFFCLALRTCAEKVQGAAISQLDVTCTE